MSEKTLRDEAYRLSEIAWPNRTPAIRAALAQARAEGRREGIERALKVAEFHNDHSKEACTIYLVQQIRALLAESREGEK